MPIYRLLEKSPLGPEKIKRMTEAYEIALGSLKISNSVGPLNELVAQKIIAAAQTSDEEPKALAGRALKEIGIPLPR